jgi:catechol 2,3-dioxygenase-like lactoylglutathione lyase family enzyme
MALRIGSVVLHVDDLARAGAFWQQAIGYEPAVANPAFLRPVDHDGPELHLDDSDHTHLDLWAVETTDIDHEVTRLLTLGAQRVDWNYPPDADFVVLSDPEGNLFCIIEICPSPAA